MTKLELGRSLNSVADGLQAQKVLNNAQYNIIKSAAVILSTGCWEKGWYFTNDGRELEGCKCSNCEEVVKEHGYEYCPHCGIHMGVIK